MSSSSRDPSALEIDAARRETARGVVGAVAAMHRDAGAAARHAGIVDRVFGPGAGERPESDGEAPRGGARPLYPEIDVEFSLGEVARKLACVLGPASKIAGDLVADENVEIQGLVEGRIRARCARVTIGKQGFVRSRIEARSVRIRGTVRGNVTAEDWIEVKPGGVIRGDVRAPRVILHDGAIVTGRLERCRPPPCGGAPAISIPSWSRRVRACGRSAARSGRRGPSPADRRAGGPVGRRPGGPEARAQPGMRGKLGTPSGT